MALVLMPGHIEPFSRHHSWYAILGESLAMDELGHLVNAPSLRFGIVEALGLVLGQICDGTYRGIGNLPG